MTRIVVVAAPTAIRCAHGGATPLRAATPPVRLMRWTATPARARAHAPANRVFATTNRPTASERLLRAARPATSLSRLRLERAASVIEVRIVGGAGVYCGDQRIAVFA